MTLPDVLASASAPGKIILMGEHAAVYHRPALVAAVDRRLEAVFETAGEGLGLELPSIGVRESTSWPAVADYARRARQHWQRYETTPGPETFAALRGGDRAHLVKVALGEAVLHLGRRLPPARLRLTSNIPIGAGFGSSAALAVAVVAATAALVGERLDPDGLHRLTLEVERRQHGTPSGIDNATVIHGGLLWAVKTPEGELSTTPLGEPEGELFTALRVFNTGEPAQPTGEVVAAVRRRKDDDPRAVEALLDRMETATHALREVVTTPTGLDTPRRLFREFQACLEALGVVPEAVRRRVRAVEAAGGAAKISGAGALAGPGAGSLLVIPPHPRDLGHGLESLDVRLGAPGLEVVDTSAGGRTSAVS
jgi:mevalonate kinase